MGKRIILALIILLLSPCTALALDWVRFSRAEADLGAVPEIRIIASTGATLDLDVRVPGAWSQPLQVQGRDMTAWTLPGATAQITAGAPQLPYLARLLALQGPDARVEVLTVRERRLHGVHLAPAASKPDRCGNGRIARTCDPSAYGTDALVPPVRAGLDSVGVSRGQPVGRLTLWPVRYNPVRGEALVAERMRIRVHLGTRGWGKKISPDRSSPTFDATHEAVLLNVGDADRMAVVPGAERLLIIAHDDLVEALTPLITWKALAGITTRLVPMSSVGNTAGQVQDWIADAYHDENPPSYVLLVGDFAQVPPLFGCPEQIPSCASDFLFSTIDGNDLYSDVIVSRLSASSPDEVAVQVARIVAYERNPPSGDEADWMGGVTLVASNEGSDPSDAEYCDAMAAIYQQSAFVGAAGADPIVRLYAGEGQARDTLIAGAIEDGTAIVTYLGHGSGTAWSSTANGEFNNADIWALDNEGRWPIVMDVSCKNGQFNLSTGDCMAEAWLNAGSTASPRGAVATYSASTDTPWDEPAVMATGFATAIADGSALRWGQAALLARAHLIQQMGDSSPGGVVRVLHQYVQFGDATMMMRTAPPGMIEAALPERIPMGRFELAVAVTDGTGPLAGALLSLTKADEVAVNGVSGDDGNVTVVIDPATGGTMDVVITARNRIPLQTTIEVTPESCALLQATPAIQTCSKGVLIQVWDSDRNADPAARETVPVSVTVPPGGGFSFDLVETGEDSAVFAGTLLLDDAALMAGHGDVVTVSYDDGICTPDGPLQASVTLDCEAPVATSVVFSNVTDDAARLVVDTDEPASLTLRQGTTTPLPDTRVFETRATHREIALSGLEANTTYLLDLVLADALGNVRVDDRDGTHHRFTTLACVPACTNRDCGDNGCGGVCGTCQPNETCSAGECQALPPDVIEPAPDIVQDVASPSDVVDADTAEVIDQDAPQDTFVPDAEVAEIEATDVVIPADLASDTGLDAADDAIDIRTDPGTSMADARADATNDAVMSTDAEAGDAVSEDPRAQSAGGCASGRNPGWEIVLLLGAAVALLRRARRAITPA